MCSNAKNHVIVWYQYGAGQMKLILRKGASVTVKQLSHVNNFIAKEIKQLK